MAPTYEYTPLDERARPSKSLLVLAGRIFFGALALVAVVNLSFYVRDKSYHDRIDTLSRWSPGQHAEQEIPEKPRGWQVVGLVFYGRESTVSILDCYLQRNLVRNGGVMDEIRFIVRTKDANDLKYLNKLLEANPEYTSTLERGFDSFSDYSKTWDNIDVNNDTLYIKIDDDVVFLEDTTLPIVAQKLADHPEYFAVSANVINNPALSWIHWYLGVVLPYLPEMTPPDQVLDDPDWNRSPSWRASKLPSWTGSSTFDFRSDFPAPYEGHRWLPVRNASSDDGTPITTTTFDKSSSGWWSWSVAAQQHYSFLDHLERDELWRYKFDILDYHYDRITVNLLGMRGKDIIEGRPFPRDDEGYVSQTLPKKTGRHAIIAGGALAVHMHFNAQRQAHDGHGIMWTDALERYRSYAKENVCGRPTR